MISIFIALMNLLCSVKPACNKRVDAHEEHTQSTCEALAPGHTTSFSLDRHDGHFTQQPRLTPHQPHTTQARQRLHIVAPESIQEGTSLQPS